MGVYDIDGYSLNSVYNIDGQILSQAYDIDGNPLIETGNEITVMTYNTQWFSGINSNLSMQQSIFETYDPYIVGFQEFRLRKTDPTPQVAQTLLQDYYYQNGEGTIEALASKTQFTDLQTVLFENYYEYGQGYMRAKISLFGHSVDVFVVHLVTSDYETIKVAESQEIFDAVDGLDYFIILADFNTVCKSTADTEYTTIMKKFVDAGYHCANCTNQHGFIDTWTDGRSLQATWYPTDHIITSSNIRITDVVADTTKITVAAQTRQVIDHLPLIAKLSFD